MGVGVLFPTAGKGALVTVTRRPSAQGWAGRPPLSQQPRGHSPLARVPGSGGMPPRPPARPEHLSTTNRETEAAGGLPRAGPAVRPRTGLLFPPLGPRVRISGPSFLRLRLGRGVAAPQERSPGTILEKRPRGAADRERRPKVMRGEKTASGP